MAHARNSRHKVSIVLMGGTGTGKTTFANLVGRSKHLVGDGLESCTQNVQSHEFNFERYRVKLIDVPGFDDTSKSDADILKMIAEFLLAEYKAGRSLSGIIYVHRISDVRMGGASRRNFTMFKKLCGEDAFANVAIVTTRWDLEETAVAEARLAQLQASSQLFKSVLDGGASIHRHNRGYESACDILRHLVGKVPKPLLIQSEMVGGKEVSETAAGQELQREILEQVEKHEREMSELLEEMAQSRDASALKELEEECQAMREQIVHWQDEGKKLTGVSSGDECEAATPAEKTSPELSSFKTSTVDQSSLAQPLGKENGADGSIETEMAGIRRDLREVRQGCKENQVRIGSVERQLAGVVRLPGFLVAIADRVLALLGHYVSQ